MKNRSFVYVAVIVCFQIIHLALYCTLRNMNCSITDNSLNVSTRVGLRNVQEQDHFFGVVVQDGETKPPTPDYNLIVYVVTPTYRRPIQAPALTMLGQTLRNLDFVFWIVVEDGQETQPHIRSLLASIAVPHVYLAAETPANYKSSQGLGKGVFNRRKALEWLRNANATGVLYFADDDNIYNIRIFNEIRRTKLVSVFPVGLIGQLGVSAPIVRDGRVIGFHDPFLTPRMYAMDMAGFAVNLRLMRSRLEATIPLQIGYLEDGFLRKIGIPIENLEPLASNCTEFDEGYSALRKLIEGVKKSQKFGIHLCRTMVLAWHTRIYSGVFPKFMNIAPHHYDTNLPLLYGSLLNP